MKSEHVTDQLHDYLDGALSTADAAAVKCHVESCVQCSTEWGELRALTRALAGAAAPLPRDGVLERMLRVAVRQGVEPGPWFRTPFWNRAGLSAAALLLLVVGFGVGLQSADRKAAGPQIELAAQPVELGRAVQTVGLMFRASGNVRDASISVWLPDDVQIAGRPKVHQLSWRTDLKRGPNLLELPLQATGPHSGTVLVRLSQGSLVRTLEVPIAIRPLNEPEAKTPPAPCACGTDLTGPVRRARI